MPLCIAVTQHKPEIFELIAKRMDSTERHYYVVVRMYLYDWSEASHCGKRLLSFEQ